MMRAISLWQPYASLMALGLKTVETRGRQTHVRGDLVIHAAAAAYPYADLPEQLKKLLRAHGLDCGVLPRARVLAVVELYDCAPTEELEVTPYGNYSLGRFGWMTRNARKLETPVRCAGRQGFFFLPADVEAEVRKQLP